MPDVPERNFVLVDYVSYYCYGLLMGCPIRHYNPLEKIGLLKQRTTCLVLFIDDSDDRASDGQISLNREHYITWNTLVVPHWKLEILERDWMEIKKRHSVPLLYLHSNLHHSIITNPSSTIRNEIHQLLLDHGIIRYYSRRTKTHCDAYARAYGGAKLFQDINQKGWSLKEPKEQALFCGILGCWTKGWPRTTSTPMRWLFVIGLSAVILLIEVEPPKRTLGDSGCIMI